MSISYHHPATSKVCCAVLARPSQPRESTTGETIKTVTVNPVLVRGLKHLDCYCRDGKALASVLCSCSLYSLNLSWNDLRESETSKKGRAGERAGYPLARAALVCPARLVSLELSFNGLADAFGVRSSAWYRGLAFFLINTRKTHEESCNITKHGSYTVKRFQ